MKPALKVLLAIILISTNSMAGDQSSECEELKNMTFDQVRARIVRASIVHYEGLVGHCPCPYSFDLTLNTYCGVNSAHTKSKGKDVKCYPQEISYVDIANYKKEKCSTSLNSQ